MMTVTGRRNEGESWDSGRLGDRRGRLEVPAEYHGRALPGLGLECEDLATTPHDRETSAPLRIGPGELCPRDHVGWEAHAAVLDGRDDPVAADANLDFDRVVGARVLDCVRERFAKGDQKVREVVELGDPVANDSRSMWLRRDPEVQHRFRSIHRRFRWFPGGGI